jgi:hypothetical protein
VVLDFISGHDRRCTAYEELERHESHAGQFKSSAAPLNDTRPEVDNDICIRQTTRCRIRTHIHPPQQRSDPSAELWQGERLDEVIINTRREPCESIVEVVGSRDHEDRERRRHLRSNATTYLEARQPGHAMVKEHEGEWAF